MAKIPSSITGVVVEVLVKIGDTLKPSTEVATIESMKMHIPVEAGVSGKVSKILVQEGQSILEGEALLEVE